MSAPHDNPCPRCGGTGSSRWRQPSGLEVPVRCGLCRGAKRVDARTAEAEAPRPITEGNPTR
jgi:DnaJ-class molecular chaperone